LKQHNRPSQIKARSTLEKGGHPELYTSKYMDSDGVNKDSGVYKNQWLTTMGSFLSLF